MKTIKSLIIVTSLLPHILFGSECQNKLEVLADAQMNQRGAKWHHFLTSDQRFFSLQGSKGEIEISIGKAVIEGDNTLFAGGGVGHSLNLNLQLSKSRKTQNGKTIATYTYTETYSEYAFGLMENLYGLVSRALGSLSGTNSDEYVLEIETEGAGQNLKILAARLFVRSGFLHLTKEEIVNLESAKGFEFDSASIQVTGPFADKVADEIYDMLPPDDAYHNDGIEYRDIFVKGTYDYGENSILIPGELTPAQVMDSLNGLAEVVNNVNDPALQKLAGKFFGGILPSYVEKDQ